MDEVQPRELDADGILAILNRHAVHYVVIGGMAGILHGSGLTTADLDITPAQDDANLENLSAALEELEAELRVTNAPSVPFPRDPTFLRQMTTVTLRTRLGDLDICFRPTAPGRDEGYTFDDLARKAVLIELDEPVPVASLDDVIASKEASGRPKDLATLGVLYRLREILSEQEGPPSTSAHRHDASQQEHMGAELARDPDRNESEWLDADLG